MLHENGRTAAIAIGLALLLLGLASKWLPVEPSAAALIGAGLTVVAVVVVADDVIAEIRRRGKD